MVYARLLSIGQALLLVSLILAGGVQQSSAQFDFGDFDPGKFNPGGLAGRDSGPAEVTVEAQFTLATACLLYTSDAADE